LKGGKNLQKRSPHKVYGNSKTKMAVISFIESALAFQRGFHYSQVSPVMAQNSWIPLTCAAVYLAFVFGVPKLMNVIAPTYKGVPGLKWPFVFWNFLLSTFSTVGALVVVPTLLWHLYTEGFHSSLCTDPKVGYANGTSGFWIMLFIVSKFPELLDTAFLVLQKKPVIFLHWFHHATVMLYCWHAYANMVGVGWYFVAMNLSVHAVMYFYYAMMSLSTNTRAMVKPMAQFITTIQIVQMLVGAAVTVIVRVLATRDADSCPSYDETNNQLGFAMYAVYFGLFAQLFLPLVPRSRREEEASGQACCHSRGSFRCTPVCCRATFCR